MNEKIIAVCSSIVGSVRKHNEDNFYFAGHERCLEEEQNLKMTIKDGDVISVFDGMGGESLGDIASLTASVTLRDYLEHNKYFDWKEYVNLANEAVLTKASKNEIVGTTLAGLFLNGNDIEICNVGDSKIFGLKGKNLIQLSIDDNEELINKKLGINRKGALTQHLGLKDDEIEIIPHIKQFSKQEFDKIIICSDGLTDMVDKKEITSILLNNKLEDSIKLLIDKVKEQGAKDNTTIIIMSKGKEKRNFLRIFKRRKEK